ncbi:transcriptional regulator [Neoasaia chiangmaiensis]|uniref:Transcriptional regulator n=1 Tax=Neoasaia chiangmaiensis TaxID=320497 RepID=A0A1U9KLU6_9PROT|nr:transcriptional regulator [Neoasaia chiangmaiensis]
MSTHSTSSSRSALVPQRADGRQRVAAILNAAAQVFEQRGYDATTMAEIATSAGARIGSLYRFFPNKESVAEALMTQQMAILHEEYAAIQHRADTIGTPELADLLVDLLVTHYPRINALPILMDAHTNRTEIRRHSRALALAGIAAAIGKHAPHISTAQTADIAAVVANNMKTMLGMTNGSLPTSNGASDELRFMNRLYLVSRLKAAPIE